MHSPRMTLDNPVLASRRRTTLARRSTYERRALVPVARQARMISDVTKPKNVLPAKQIKPASQAHASRHSHSRVLKREALQKVPVRTPGHTRRRSSFKSKALTAMAIVLFAFGAWVGVMGLRSNHKVEAQVEHLARQAVAGDSTNADVPDEQKPTIHDYHVTPTQPKILRIKKLAVEARVMRTTVNSKNQLGSPANIYDTAWYDGSALPGEAGAMLIDGHVSGPTKDGVFYDLRTIRAGDKLSIERGDGKLFSYTVVKTNIYDVDKVDMGAVFTPVTPGKPGLNLITCAGKVDQTGNAFTQRLIVFAEQD